MAITKVPGYSPPKQQVWGPDVLAAMKKAGTSYHATAAAPIPKPTVPTYTNPFTTPATPAAKASTGLPSVTPQQILDWNPYVTDITTAPDYASAAVARQTGLDALARTRQTANRQAVIAAGFDPGSADTAGDIDQATLAAALSNPMSTSAVLQKTLNTGLGGVPYELARRGAVRSGAAVTHAGAIRDAYDQQSFQALQSLLGALGTNQSTYAQGALGVEDAWQQAQRDITTRLANLAFQRNLATSDYGGPNTPEDVADATGALPEPAYTSTGIVPLSSPYYYGGGGMSPLARTPTISVPANSPYYYGGGGGAPSAVARTIAKVRGR